MAAQPERSKWVGNAGLIIGLPWHKRKSLPRNNKGFEPVEGYFDRTSSSEESDSDSSETDTEELVRQEKEKRIEAEARRRAVEEAKKNAAYLMKLAAAKKQAEEAKAQQQLQGDGETEREKKEEEAKKEVELESDNRNETLTENNAALDGGSGGEAEGMVDGGGAEGELEVGSVVEVFAVKATSGSVVEDLYSPNTSAAVENSPSSAKKEKKLMPSRLSFSDVEEEQSSDKEHSDSRRSPRKTEAKMNLQSSFLAASNGLETVPLPSGASIIPRSGHIISTNGSSFRPAKTSTQLKSRKKQQKGGGGKRKGGKNSKKLPPSIRMELSDSESERDEALALLLADDTEHFQGLSQLTRSKMSNEGTSSKSEEIPAATVAVSAKPAVAVPNDNNKTRRFAKKSTGNRAGQKKTARKSVTFVSGSGSESEGERGEERRRRMEGVAVLEPRSPRDDIYMSFDEDHMESPKSYKPKKGDPKLTPPTKLVRNALPSDTDEDSEQLTDTAEKEEPRTVKKATPKRPTLILERVPTKTKERPVRTRISDSPERDTVPHSSRNLLKDISSVVPKTTAIPSSFSTSAVSSQWFVPGMGLPPRKRQTTAKKTTKKNRKTAAPPQRENTKAPPTTFSAVSEREVDVEYYVSDEQPIDYMANEDSDTVDVGLSQPVPSISATSLASSEAVVEERDGGPIRKKKGGHLQKTELVASKRGEDRDDGAVEEKNLDKTDAKPKKKRGRKPKSKVLASSESELEGEPAQKQGGVDQDKKMTKEKRKRGRPRKGTSLKDPDTASSESELEEWLASVRQNQQKTTEKGEEQRKKKMEEAGQSKAPRQRLTSQSKLEKIVQGLKSDTTRERRRSPRKMAQASASSESEIDVGPTQDEESESQSDASRGSKRGGRRRGHKTAPVAASVQSESEQERSESGNGQIVDSESGASVRVITLESVSEGATDAEDRGRGAGLKRGRKLGAAFASSESRAVEKSDDKKSKSKRKKGHPSVAERPTTSAMSESEAGGGVESAEQANQKAAPKQGRRKKQKLHVAVSGQTSSSAESDVEGIIKTTKQKGCTKVASDNELASENEDRLSRPKKKRGKVKVNIEENTLGSGERENEVPQHELSDYIEMGGVVSPPTMYEEDVNIDSDSPAVSHPPYPKGPGAGGSRGGVRSGDYSRADAVETSTSPQPVKKKRKRGKKVNLIPNSKKKKSEKKAQRTVLATPAPSSQHDDPHVFSMSVSGEGENINGGGVELTRSAGGRRYRRLRVGPLKEHTPGVRRSNRTRVAPVRHWENEVVEYDMSKSGAVMKAVLVPLQEEEESEGTESETDRRRRKRKGEGFGKGTGKRFKLQEDDEFEPLRFSDNMGNTQELPIVHTFLSASRINCSGEPVFDQQDADVVIHRLNSNQRSSKGLMTFSGYGEKPKSSTRTYDMFFYVLKGKLLFQVNEQEFTLSPYSSIEIPGGCVYSIRNIQNSEAEIVFTTNYIEPIVSD